MGYGKAGIELLMHDLCAAFAIVRLEVLVGNETGLRSWKSIGFEDCCLSMVFQMGDDPQPEKQACKWGSTLSSSSLPDIPVRSPVALASPAGSTRSVQLVE